jgi:hypothetical protein
MKFKGNNYNRLLLDETFNQDLYSNNSGEIALLLI